MEKIKKYLTNLLLALLLMLQSHVPTVPKDQVINDMQTDDDEHMFI